MGGLYGKRPGSKIKIIIRLRLITDNGLSIGMYWEKSYDKIPGVDLGR